ncbi:hypothetical protein RRG08_046961 [Elysia crispata]|uniref:Uncharacterized protein n=1 Tax=Elysia crispata TaxID=231223 RepID=A0AAE1DUG3_9GAST|nr:hypothetical protein RRG08_046961 [Elysia crispata]
MELTPGIFTALRVALTNAAWVLGKHNELWLGAGHLALLQAEQGFKPKLCSGSRERPQPGCSGNITNCGSVLITQRTYQQSRGSNPNCAQVLVRDRSLGARETSRIVARAGHSAHLPAEQGFKPKLCSGSRERPQPGCSGNITNCGSVLVSQHTYQQSRGSNPNCAQVLTAAWVLGKHHELWLGAGLSAHLPAEQGFKPKLCSGSRERPQPGCSGNITNCGSVLVSQHTYQQSRGSNPNCAQVLVRDRSLGARETSRIVARCWSLSTLTSRAGVQTQTVLRFSADHSAHLPAEQGFKPKLCSGSRERPQPGCSGNITNCGSVLITQRTYQQSRGSNPNCAQVLVRDRSLGARETSRIVARCWSLSTLTSRAGVQTQTVLRFS